MQQDMNFGSHELCELSCGPRRPLKHLSQKFREKEQLVLACVLSLEIFTKSQRKNDKWHFVMICNPISLSCHLADLGTIRQGGAPCHIQYAGPVTSWKRRFSLHFCILNTHTHKHTRKHTCIHILSCRIPVAAFGYSLGQCE